MLPCCLNFQANRQFRNLWPVFVNVIHQKFYGGKPNKSVEMAVQYYLTLQFLNNSVLAFIPSHRKHSQSEYRKAVLYLKYYNQPSHHALRVCRVDYVSHSMAWYKGHATPS